VSAPNRSTALAQISWISLASYTSEALYLLRGLLLAGLLGPGLFGVWSSMRIVRRLSRFASLGAVQGMLQLVPQAEGRGDRDAARHYRRIAVGVGLTASIALAALVAAIAGFPGSAQRPLWLAFAVVLVCARIHGLQNSILRSQQRFERVAAGSVGVAACSTLAGVPAAWLFGLPGFLAALAVSYGVVFVAVARGGATLPGPRLEGRAAGRLIGVGLPIVAAQLLEVLLANADKLLLWGIAGSHALGLYTLPSYVVNLALFLPGAVQTVLYPRLLRRIGRTGSFHAAGPYLERVTVAVAHVTCLVLATLYLVFPLPIVWWLPQYETAIDAGRVLLLVAFLRVVGALPATILISTRAPGRLGAIRGCSLVLTLLLVTVTLAAGGNLRDVALATAPGYALQTLALLVAAAARAGLSRERSLWLLAAVFAPYALLLILIATVGAPVPSPGGSPFAAVRELLPSAAWILGALAALALASAASYARGERGRR
jgi:O-antigen/teichoic acid export membrane protein